MVITYDMQLISMQINDVFQNMCPAEAKRGYEAEVSHADYFLARKEQKTRVAAEGGRG